MEVQILCRKLIKPSVPTPPHLRTLKLSPVDQVQYPIKPALLLYYSAESSTGSAEEVDQRRRIIMINRLETSLSETLIRFYPLAGRYVEDGNWVDCNDEGVEFFVAEVMGRLSQVVLSRRDQTMEQLVHLAGGGFTSPVASVQINLFDCGGAVIGVRISHHLVDAFSAVTFLTCWAAAASCKQGTDYVDGPNFDVASILSSNGIPNMKPMPPLTGFDNSVTKRMVFDGAAISALRARAHDPSFPRLPSRVELVTALIWRARMRMSRAKHGRLRTSLAAHNMNLRPRIVPPLPPLPMGNLQSRLITRFVADRGSGDTEAEVPELKVLVGLLIDSFTKSKERVVGREDVYRTLLGTRNELHEAVEKGEVDVFMFNSLCRFPFYQVDFGWGKPVWVSRIPFQGLSGACLMDTEDAGYGIEAWVCLTKQDMSIFLRDTDISAFTPELNPRSKF